MAWLVSCPPVLYHVLYSAHMAINNDWRRNWRQEGRRKEEKTMTNKF